MGHFHTGVFIPGEISCIPGWAFASDGFRSALLEARALGADWCASETKERRPFLRDKQVNIENADHACSSAIKPIEIA